MCRCSDLGFLLSVSGGIGSQKGSLRTRSEAWSFTRTRSPTAASPPVIADCAPVTCAVVGSFILGRHYDCVNDTPMRALCGFVLCETGHEAAGSASAASVRARDHF
jgi:hypothetical protein